MKHVADILKAAGAPIIVIVPKDDDDVNEPVVAAAASSMETWLGLKETVASFGEIEEDAVTVEDCLPLSESVYAAAVDWLVHAWNGNGALLSMGPTTITANPLLTNTAKTSESSSTSSVSLEAAFDSVRATKWLRAWMEFNVLNDHDDSAGLYSSLSRRLLLTDAMEPSVVAGETSNLSDESSGTITVYTKASPKNALLRALYKHVLDLPDLQQQLLFYSQHLQRADPHSIASAAGTGTTDATSSLLKDPNSRLRQYERAMAVSNRLSLEFEEHVDRLQWILGDIYAAADSNQRKLCRRLLGHVWSTFILQSSSSSSSSLRQENTKAAAISMTLTVLRRILLGMQSMSDATHHLLFHQLIPLHKADAVVLWRDQTAVLELYHEPLCQCMAVILQQHGTKHLIPAVIQQLLQPTIFPVAGSTPKQVLLLHEIDTYLRLLASDTTDEDSSYLREERVMMHSLLQTLARCMSSENSRVAERALQFFQNAAFEELISGKHLELALNILLPALVRREPSWNPTVRKMTYHILKKLQGYDEAVFETVCNRIFSQVDHVTSMAEGETTTSPKVSSIVASQMEEAAATRAMAPSTTDFSLKAGMGNWRPPTTRESGSMPPPTSRRPSNPSSTTPGRGSAPRAKVPTSRPDALSSSAAAPPLTVTGVAPWAMKLPAPALGHNKRGAPEAPLKEITDDSVQAADGDDESPKAGLEYVLANMENIKPPPEEEGVSSWSRAQMAETPTYLPNLKFHDLVFGHDLGSGAFGSVKYARLIEKTKPRSQWPEYAVKVVSTEKIRAMGYEASIQREIAVLRFLSHPGIARLVSSFRFHDGAYLVLEYASRGDLHTLLQKHGSLDLDSTRFVIGEVVAALASIHERGFVYGDLKPENIVITETGHIKLTDFGGCRPITEDAKALIKSVAKDLLKNLRDGDWKARPPSVTSGSGYDSTSSNDAMEVESVVGGPDGDDADVEEPEEDVRIEGTIAYLPPEVVMGAFPTVAADAWALGCVTYQCLSGRPLLLEADDEATRNRIVSFDFYENASKSEIDRVFEDKHAAGITAEARDMIKSLLDRDPSKRPGMNQLAEHPFFTSNVFALYSQPAFPLDVGTVSPTTNAQWARRQYSSIWAPQPEAYNVSMPDDSQYGSAGSVPSTDAPIPEGEEASVLFSPSGTLPSTTTAPIVGRRSERIMLPPS